MEVLNDSGMRHGARVLDVGTGTGALAVTAAQAGAAHVTAVDVSRRAVAAARVNTLVRGLPVRVQRGDAWNAVRGRWFDVVVANPPYVPSDASSPPARGASRAWEAGARGRRMLDRLCTHAPRLLAPKGRVLLVQSGLCGVDETVQRLRDAQLQTSVVTRRTNRFGPVLTERSDWLQRQGLIEPGQRDEELVVIRGDRTD